MHFNTAYNHRIRLVSIVHDLFSSLRTYSQSSDWISVKLNDKVYNDAGYKRCPTWVKSYVSGVIDTLRTRIDRDIEFMYVYEENFIPLKSAGIQAIIDSTHNKSYKDIPSVFVWKHSGKVYSETGTTAECDGLSIVYGTRLKYFRVHKPEEKKWYLVHCIGEDAENLKHIYNVMGWQSLINYLDMNYDGWNK